MPFSDMFIPEPNSGCWLWIGACDSVGYGNFRIKNKSWKAHRFSWTIHNGIIPDGLFVLHKCDVRPCINPNHLFLGTHLDNMRDMHAKGRARCGGHRKRLYRESPGKVCPQCKKWHNWSEFNSQRKYCLSCHAINGRIWRMLNPQKQRESQKKYRKKTGLWKFSPF